MIIAKYKEHELFEKPDFKDKLFRYMTFTKFLSLLENKALFFCRSDRLGDPFEGSYPKQNVINRLAKEKEGIFSCILSSTFKEIRKFILLNCWSLGECESAALWNYYTKGNEGIAVQTTFGRFKNSFGTTGNQPVLVGKVNYIDYYKESFPEKDCFYSPFLYKRKSFEYEHEVRAVIMKFPKGMKDYIEITRKKLPALYELGEYVKVDIISLIENVYVAPTSQLWFRNLVDSVMKKYGIDLTPIRSDLDADPIY